MAKKETKKGRGFEIIKFIAELAILIVVYFIAGKFGLTLAFVNASASAIWIPTGISIAMLLILGYRFWPAIFLGAFFVNFTTAGTITTSLGIATGNMLEALIGAFFINKLANGANFFDRPKNTLMFSFAAAMACVISATIGVASLSFEHFASWGDYIPIWITWWIGDFVGALVITPLIIKWNSPMKINGKLIFKSFLIMIAVFLAASLVFTGWFPLISKNYILFFIFTIALAFLCFKIGERGASLAILIALIVAVYGTINGFGPFKSYDTNTALVLLQIYMGLLSFICLIACSFATKQRKLKKYNGR